MQYEFQLPSPPPPEGASSSPDAAGPSTYTPRSPSSTSSSYFAAGDSEIDDAPSVSPSYTMQYQPPPYPPPAAIRGGIVIPEGSLVDPYHPVPMPHSVSAPLQYPINSSPIQQLDELPSSYPYTAHHSYHTVVPLNPLPGPIGTSYASPPFASPAEPQSTSRASPVHHLPLHSPIPQDPYPYPHFASLPNTSPSSSHSPTHGAHYPPVPPFEPKGRRYTHH